MPDLAAFSPAEMHERFEYRGVPSSKPLGGRSNNDAEDIPSP
jgi:hypothetical protein